MSGQDLNLKALFLGPKSENKETFSKHLNTLLQDHSEWRKNYHPEDKNIIKTSDFHAEDFQMTADKMNDVLVELSRKLRSK